MHICGGEDNDNIADDSSSMRIRKRSFLGNLIPLVMPPTPGSINEVVVGLPRTGERLGVLIPHALWIGRGEYCFLGEGLFVIIDLYPLGPEQSNFLLKSSATKNIWHNIGTCRTFLIYYWGGTQFVVTSLTKMVFGGTLIRKFSLMM
jgi:hypothetical protein